MNETEKKSGNVFIFFSNQSTLDSQRKFNGVTIDIKHAKTAQCLTQCHKQAINSADVLYKRSNFFLKRLLQPSNLRSKLMSP
jgi:hypothetical protein